MLQAYYSLEVESFTENHFPPPVRLQFCLRMFHQVSLTGCACYRLAFSVGAWNEAAAAQSADPVIQQPASQLQQETS